MKRGFLAKLASISLIVALCCQTALAAGATSTAQFTETDVMPPQVAKADTYPVSLIPHSDGSLDYFTMVYDAKGMPSLRQFYSKDAGKNWTEKECKWGAKVLKDYGKNSEKKVLTDDIFMDKDGTCYFGVGSWSDNTRHFIAAKPDGTYKEIPMPAWKTDHDQISVSKVMIDGNGDYQFAYDTLDGALYLEVIDGKTGAVKQRITDDFGQYVSFAGNIAASGGLMDYISFYDLSNGKHLRDVKVPNAGNSWGTGDMVFTQGEDGAAYLVRKSGFERLAKGGSTFEMLMEGSRYYFGDKESSLREMAKQPGADVFYIIMHMDDNFRFCRYAPLGK